MNRPPRLTARAKLAALTLALLVAAAVGVLLPGRTPAPDPRVPCYLGVHHDGNADVYCGDQDDAPPGVRVAPLTGH